MTRLLTSALALGALGLSALAPATRAAGAPTETFVVQAAAWSDGTNWTGIFTYDPNTDAVVSGSAATAANNSTDPHTLGLPYNIMTVCYHPDGSSCINPTADNLSITMWSNADSALPYGILTISLVAGDLARWPVGQSMPLDAGYPAGDPVIFPTREDQRFCWAGYSCTIERGGISGSLYRLN